MASITTTTTKDGAKRYRVRYRTAEGRSAEQWMPTLAAARALKTQLDGDHLSGGAIDPRSGAVTLADYFDRWLPARLVSGRPLTPATRLGYQRLWRRNIAATIGRRQLREIRPSTVRDWHASVTTSASADQAAKSYRLLRAVLATAEADELVRVNPCRLRGAGQERHDERPLVATSLVLDLADAIGERYRALVLVAGLAGLRTGESLGLRRCDVDLLHATVSVVQQAQEQSGMGRITLAPKSDAGRRVVHVPTLVVDALDAHLATFTAPDADAPVFTGPEGGPLRRATLSAAWRAAVRSTGAPEGLHVHDLRHHAATLTAQTPGITTKELMARIGHASPRAALIYQHASAERDRSVAGHLDSVLAATVRPAGTRIVEIGPGVRSRA